MLRPTKGKSEGNFRENEKGQCQHAAVCEAGEDIKGTIWWRQTVALSTNLLQLFLLLLQKDVSGKEC